MVLEFDLGVSGIHSMDAFVDELGDEEHRRGQLIVDKKFISSEVVTDTYSQVD